MRCKNFVTVALFVLGGMALARVSEAIVIGQLDDFEDGTTQGWTEGVVSPNPPTVSSPGPDGGLFLEDVSSGTLGAGSRMAFFNEQAWAGDYLSAHVVAVEMDVNNLGNTDMFLRIGLGMGALAPAPRGGYVTETAVQLAAGSGWQHVTFSIDGTALISAGVVPPPLETVLADVTHFRIFSSVAVDWRGDSIAAVIGVDNIRTLGLPGDGNGDGWVNGSDYVIWANNYLDDPAVPAGPAGGDFNRDTVVNGSDYLIWATHYLTHVGTAVPEPGTFTLAGLALAGLLVTRRRRC